MPNIIITEGLDEPWEIAKTESNITEETDLESINLANQVVGRLAYTASQMFSAVDTEKDNLDKIVDAIELLNEEIALFPERIAKWDTKLDLGIPDSAAGIITLPVEQLSIATQKTTTNPNLSASTPINFLGLTSSGLEEEKTYINTLLQLISAKPLLDTAGVVDKSQVGYVVLYTLDQNNIGGDSAVWQTRRSIVEGTVPGSGGSVGDLVVYRDASGQPTSYEFISLFFLTPDDPSAEPEIVRRVLNPDQVLSFAVPRDVAELKKWREAVQATAQIAATQTLRNMTGLPEGVTPPVTTLGVSVDKYFDRARYSTIEVTRQNNGTINATPGQTPKIIYGDYPPLSPENLDLNKLTTADVNKFFQEPGTNRIFYIESVTDGKISYRLVTKEEAFISEMTDDIEKSLRGEYAEKQILLTQRSTDQTLFVTSISQRYVTFTDLATNLMKTLMNLYNDLARNIRS